MSNKRAIPVALAQDELARALDYVAHSVVITDLNGIIRYVNRAFTHTTGYTLTEAMGKTPAVLKSGQTPAETYEDMWRTISSGQTWTGRLLNKRKGKLTVRIHGSQELNSENLYWSSLSISPVRDENGEICSYVATHADVTSDVRLEQQREYERKEAGVRVEVFTILQREQPLRDRLRDSLAELLKLNELRVQNKAGVFLKPEGADHLEIFVMHGAFSDDFIRREQKVALGSCLCGRAAVTGEAIVSDDCFCDARHDRQYEGMTAHGHYIVPLRAGGRTLGIMFLYTDPYPSREEHRLVTLESVGDAMALAIANEEVHKRLLAASNSALEASEAKSRFLANMSHEIRTPLGGILGFTDLLRRAGDAIQPHERREWVENIHHCGRHLLELINEILDLSKVEAGQLEVEAIPCHIIEILAELSSLFRFKAGEKGLTFDVINEGPIPKYVTTDPTRLRQILTNLLGNAIKFTSSGSITLTIRACPPGAGLEIDIADTGQGIPPDKLKAVFDPFVQADSSVTRKSGGTGLGLAISRRMTEALGGSLSVQSEVGRGSVSTLRVAVEPVENTDWIDDLTKAIVHLPVKKETSSPNRPRLAGHILLVDDAANNRKLISLVLERAGMKVTTAPDGQAALDLIPEHDFDLVLMDMQMPILDGYSATRALRQRGSTLPIVALTAHAMQSDREKCLAAGCDEYLQKPIDFDALLVSVAKLLGQSVTSNPQEKPTNDAPSSEVLHSTLPMDDVEFREAVEEFVDRLHGKLEEMREAQEAVDWKRLSETAHWLKGAGGTAGFGAFTAPAGELERSAKNHQIDEIGKTIDHLEELTGRIELSGRAGSYETNAEKTISS